jgi:hypothetical protein
MVLVCLLARKRIVFVICLFAQVTFEQMIAMQQQVQQQQQTTTSVQRSINTDDVNYAVK